MGHQALSGREIRGQISKLYQSKAICTVRTEKPSFAPNAVHRSSLTMEPIVKNRFACHVCLIHLKLKSIKNERPCQRFK